MSDTRQEELLFGMEKLRRMNTLRQMIDLMNNDEKTLTPIDRLAKSENNDEFLESLKTA